MHVKARQHHRHRALLHPCPYPLVPPPSGKQVSSSGHLGGYTDLLCHPALLRQFNKYSDLRQSIEAYLLLFIAHF